MENELVLSGRFYYQGKFQELMVGVQSGVVTEIRKSITGDRVVKIEGGILPASTDTHVHFRDPGETDKEDFPSGSMSAVYGGTTTVVDMPNNIVPITDYERFENKLSSIKEEATATTAFIPCTTGTMLRCYRPKATESRYIWAGAQIPVALP